MTRKSSKKSVAVVADYQQRIDTLTRAYNDGNFDGSVTTGVEAGRLAVDIVSLGAAAAGVTKVVAITAKAGAGLIAGDIANVTADAAKGAIPVGRDSALNPKWGNPATSVVKIGVPAGTKFYEGVAASEGGLVGGGGQVVFPKGFKIDPSWVRK